MIKSHNGPPATAVRFGNRPAPSVGRHLTGQKGLGRPLRTRPMAVNFLVRRTAAACGSNLLPHVDTGGCSSDGDALHGPVFHGRAWAMPIAAAVRIWPNR